MPARILPRRLAAATAVCGLVAGCGGATEAPAPPRPQLAFPPKAFEPATAPARTGKLPGRVVDVGPKPEGVAVDARTGTVAVALDDPPALVLLDAGTGAERARVKLPGGARHVTLARPGGPFLVPIEDEDVIVEVGLPGGDTRVTPAGDNPHGVTFADGDIYSGDEFGSTISVLRGGRRVRQVPVDVQPGGLVVVGDEIAIVSVRANTIELFDRRTLRGGGSQNVGYGPSHAVADAAGRVYVADTRGGAISVFETKPRLKFVGRTELGGSPYGIAIDTRRARLWVTLTGRNELVELTAAATPERRRSFPTVAQPNTVGVDEGTGRLYVASRSDGTLQIIGP